MNHQAVLFISFGGPEKRDDIMPFLEIVTRGRGIPKARLMEVAHHYELMGGASPINEITRRQAQALEKLLAELGTPLPVYVGQRNWHPFLEDTLRRMKNEGVKRAIGFITAAHRCEASYQRYIAAVDEARQAVGAGAPEIDYVDPWFDHPLFISALTERVKEKLKDIPDGTPWYFVAHSIPESMANESPYVADLNRTAELVSAQFGRDSWRIAYSSRSGNPRDPWLEPDICDVIQMEAMSGSRAILFITIGFIADHVEVLFDQDVEAKAVADEARIRFYRSETVGDHPQFIRMMANLVQLRLACLEASL